MPSEIVTILNQNIMQIASKYDFDLRGSRMAPLPYPPTNKQHQSYLHSVQNFKNHTTFDEINIVNYTDQYGEIVEILVVMPNITLGRTSIRIEDPELFDKIEQVFRHTPNLRCKA